MNLDELIQFRHKLHEGAELSDHESRTADTVARYLEQFKPSRIIRNIGGYGLAVLFESGNPGPRVLIRCELDALPIPDTPDLPYRSRQDGVAHKCGHDGHMAIVSGLAHEFGNGKLDRGTLILLYQPSEETGQGAARVIADEKFSEIQPDYVFALHNLPGFPMGNIIVKNDTFASASKGFIIELTGATSHAAEPDRGNSPALAVSHLISGLSAIPQFYTALHEAAQVTIIHSKIGERAFGTSPGTGTVMATLRAHKQDVMDRIADRCSDLAAKIATAFDLDYKIEFVEEFPATVNNPDCVKIVRDSAQKCGLDLTVREVPFSWSEDFGHFTNAHPGALFGLGAGDDVRALHHPSYDFPDEIIEPGIRIFKEIILKMIME